MYLYFNKINTTPDDTLQYMTALFYVLFWVSKVFMGGKSRQVQYLLKNALVDAIVHVSKIKNK